MSESNVVTLNLVGTRPILLHNGALASPLNPHAKQLAAIRTKRKKTEADYAQFAKIEWTGSWILNEKGHPSLTADMILGCTVEGAKRLKRGRDAETIAVLDDFYEIKNGENLADLDALWEKEDYRFARLVKTSSGGRTMTTTPRIREWRVDGVRLEFDPDVCNRADAIEWITLGGLRVGVGAWRKRLHGRFKAEVVE